MSEGTIALFEQIVAADEVTWLTAAEIVGERPWLPAGETHVERSVRVPFETADVVARHFGADRVRLIFAFV